jgi:hypothetical protein
MASEQRHFNNHLPMGTPVDAEALQQIPKAAAAALKARPWRVVDVPGFLPGQQHKHLSWL